MPAKAFTLIELLIVVAIIAILAAIAVPNFLEAQTRAKVSRVVNDMRTMKTAIESYRVDNNKYPREHRSDLYGDERFNGQDTYSIPWRGLSTPIAYVTNAWIDDIFVDMETARPFDGAVRYIRYYDLETRPTVAIREWYGGYRLLSYGPDQDFQLSPATHSEIHYDPTNGTVSRGNIWRAQKNDDVQPGPPVLNPH